MQYRSGRSGSRGGGSALLGHLEDDDLDDLDDELDYRHQHDDTTSVHTHRYLTSLSWRRRTRVARCHTPSRQSRCTQSWTPSVISRWRSSADCWQRLATFTVDKCQQQIDDCRLFDALGNVGRAVARFSSLEFRTKFQRAVPIFFSAKDSVG